MLWLHTRILNTKIPNPSPSLGWVSVVSLLVVIVAVLLPPLPQPAEYHQFADQRSFFGISRFNDVMSNLAFLSSGAAGLVFLWQVCRTPASVQFQHRRESLPYWVLFLSVVLVTFGSIYYHWTPDTDHLLWDRLPIATGIGALLAATITERIDPKLGLRSLPLLVVLGIFSVLYWYWSERQGTGNLNFYIAMQSYSILLIVWLSLRFPSRYTHGDGIYPVVALYALAKVFELLDGQIFVWTQSCISGHTLKHLTAAYAAYRIVQLLHKRVLINR
jgi:hypothetical protein